MTTVATSLLLALLVVCLLPVTASAQYPFGKNKVIYSKKDWKVLETEHVDIYHYPNESNLIRFVAPLVEETYLEFAELFDVDFERRVPFVFYASHYDFQQTNILPYLISEYTGGFTDLIKGRIAVPFTGSYANFRHVVRHEMVHAFMLEKLHQVMTGRGKFTYNHPPLWFVEGMAEYFAASPQDNRSRMFVRDALVHNRLLDLDNIWRITGSFMMYKQGEAVINYIATNFGDEAVVQILENWWVAQDFSLVLEHTINLNLNELNDAFMKHTKRQYYPSILHNEFVTDQGEQLTPRRSFHNRPAATLDENGDLVVYALCAQDGVINVCRLRSEGGERSHGLVARGSRSATLESIPAFRSKIEAHGDTLVFVSKSNERDVIYFWHAREEEKIAAFEFPGLSLLASPTLSGDHRRLVFSAIDTTGTMDLFLYDIERERLERLTDDVFSEEDPDYHPQEDVILYASDRGTGGVRGKTRIYEMDLATRQIKPIEGNGHADSSPEWAPGGESFLFTSDRDGTFNVYHHKSNVIVRQTNVLGGVTNPSFLPDGTGFVASGYTAGEFHVFRFPIKNGGGKISLPAVAEVDTTHFVWGTTETQEGDYNTRDYSTKLGVDFVGAGIAIDPEFGDIGNGGQLVLTDILGNQQVHVFFGSTTQGVDDFWKRVNAGVSYVNLSRRLNYSLGVFHLSNFSEISTVIRQERRYGGAVGVSYPISKFRRVDGSVVVRGIERKLDFIDELTEESFTGSTFLTYVTDNTLWTIGGPLTGRRYYVTVGQTLDFLGRGFDNTNLHVDVRKYFKLTSRIAAAFRFRTRNSWGGDGQRFFLGGPWDLRGYEFREFEGRTTLLFNNEIRFPLIDGFALALPFGTIEMPMFRGALFFDAGRASRYVFGSEGWLGSMGAGVELNLGYAPVVRVNFTRQTDFDSIARDTDLELFIGYNY